MKPFSIAPIALSILCLMGCQRSTDNEGTADSRKTISESQLLEYAATAVDKSLFAKPPVVLGYLGGIQVVAEHICSDLCPDYTVRIIRFSLPENVRCADVGGVLRPVQVPMGVGTVAQKFCFPRIIDLNWDRYVRE